MGRTARGSKSPTLEDVAREAGVSRATVSRVVNGVRNVDPGIQEAVRLAIERTGYAPNRAARSLVTHRTEAVALVLSGAGDTFATRVFADPFFGRVVNGVLGFLRPRGVHPLLLVAESATAREQVVDYLRQGSADGALVVSIQADDPLPAMLAAAHIPTALFARPPGAERVSHVDLDHAAGARLAAAHLLSRGRRRLATISAPHGLPAARERLAGFRAALAEAGIDALPAVEGSFTSDSGARAMAALLADHPDLDGVFAANDLMALGACQYLREHGKDVPGDVAVVGFDDSSAALTCRPPLTTVRQPVERMSARMAELLLEQLQGTRTEPASVVFAPELVVRDSA
ncbi:LacI family DNA-binding transcriptional regulator [Streptomyces sp. NPDC001941]|uniref:LacI family DNA-binding transcriptional regulator n=1 Tax=Streptomyces sp. NPDC001941 TaxID=3154659 RepID=UPI003330EEF0